MTPQFTLLGVDIIGNGNTVGAARNSSFDCHSPLIEISGIPLPVVEKNRTSTGEQWVVCVAASAGPIDKSEVMSCRVE